MDIFIESFRPGVMERLGLGPQEIFEVNPHALYVRLTGYGQLCKTAGHDCNYLAASGVLERFRAGQGDLPAYPGNIVADYCAGSLACFTQILEAKRAKRIKYIIDSSMTHNLAYYSQPELLSNSDGFSKPYEGPID